MAFCAGLPYTSHVCAFDARLSPCLPFDPFAQTCEHLPYWQVQLTSSICRERGCPGNAPESKFRSKKCLLMNSGFRLPFVQLWPVMATPFLHPYKRKLFPWSCEDLI